MTENKTSLAIGKKAFIIATLIILLLMMVSGVLTKTLPAGSYDRKVINERTMIVADSYRQIERPNYPVWRWFTAPFEILVTEGNNTVITIILFLVLISGSIAILEKAGVMRDIVNRLVFKFKDRKYLLMAIMIFLFMFLSSFLGIYEGMIPMIIFIVPLSYSFGWDSLTGLGISLLPLAFGFAAAVTNPFTVAIAQEIAELPIYSGSWLRIIFFAVIYCFLFLFVYFYAKKIEKNPLKSIVYKEDLTKKELLKANSKNDKANAVSEDLKKALVWFSVCMLIAISFIILTSFIPTISDYSFPFMAIMFLIGGIGSGRFAKLDGKQIVRAFCSGFLGIVPGIVLILMAYSVKYIIDMGKITDTILNSAATWIENATTLGAAFLIYLITFIMNFFVGSASAKAFLMMPILSPLADIVGITRQTAVLAFDFGDGFSNMLFPSNALLLIALSFTVVSYPKWLRWTIPIQIFILIVTSLFLVFAVYINFGPF